MKNVRDQLINIILKVAMKHHDDISKTDEDAVCDAADEILKQHPELLFPLIHKDQDGLCYYCGKMTSSIAGNPSEWPLMFCHSDEPGKMKHHHTGCVTQLLNQRGIDKILLHWCFDQFDKISGCHMDCNCTNEEHEMVKLSEEAKRKIINETNIVKQG